MRVVASVLCCFAVSSFAGELFRSDFSQFSPGVLSAPIGLLNGAIQEYHYIPYRGVSTAPWYNPIAHNDSWAAGEEDGKSYIEQHLIHDQPQRFQPLFVTGDSLWSDYTVTARVRPLSLADMAGVVFRYHTNRHYYLFALTGGNKVRLALRLPSRRSFGPSTGRNSGPLTSPTTRSAGTRSRWRTTVLASGHMSMASC